MKKSILLAIETASRGGSVSIFKDNREIDFWVGEAKASRSEDLLEEIDNLLKRNNLSKQLIDKIFLSQTQGSLTGLRVGKALGLGLKNALNLKIEFYNFYDIFSVLAEDSKKVIVVIEAGRKEYIYFMFHSSINNAESSEFNQTISSPDELFSKILDIENKNKLTKLYLPLKLVEENLPGKLLDDYEYEILNPNFSKYLGLFGIRASDNKVKIRD